jgi:DNA-directed RNA polymerase subunit RPC12/RpoP
MYKCIQCKKEVEKLEDKVRCPFCGFRIYAKVRPDVVRRVVAR